jgi:hypothetical protein
MSQKRPGNESLIFFWHSFLEKDDFDLLIKNHSQSCIKVCCTHGGISAFYIPISSVIRRGMMWLLGFNLRDAGEYQANFDSRSVPEEVSIGEVVQLSLSNNLLYMGRPDDQLANQVALAKLGLRLDYFEPGYISAVREILGMILVRFPDAPRGRLYQEGERSTRRELRGSPVFLRYPMLPKELRKVAL